MRRRDSDLLARARPSRLSYSYSQCTSRSGSLESDLRGVFSDIGDNSELLNVEDMELLQQENTVKRETVRVTVRFRPLQSKEKSSRRPAWNIDAEKGTVEAEAAAPSSGQASRKTELFSFDEVYDGYHSTQTIYDGLARSIARSALDGIHGTIFAYGQTSSGKTYTMQGSGLRSRRMSMRQEQKVEMEEDRRPDDADGLVQLAVKDLFDEMARRVDAEYLVRVSYLEVYNETVKDLLVSSLGTTGKRRNSTVHIREHPVTGVFTDNSERVVTTAREVLQALRDGEKQRAVEATRMNERSSRSHSIFRVVIETKTRLESPVPTDDEDDEAGVEIVRVGCLNFVDLAGSESARAVSSGGKKLTTESGNINRSLLALSRVVVALSSSKSMSQQDHVNFRDSKLTRILQPSLSGAARVLFVCCASSSPAYIEDTCSTLKFASRAKRIKVNASVNEVVDQRARALMELSRVNQLLRRHLETFASASRNEMDAMEDYIVYQRMRIVSLEAAAAATVRFSLFVREEALDCVHKDRCERQLEFTGLEEANALPALDSQVLEMDLSDGEETYVDSQFGSLTESPLLVADAACVTCEALDIALENAKTRELKSYMRIEQLEAYIDQLEHQENDNSSSSATSEGSGDGEKCVLNVGDYETDEIMALAGRKEGGVSSIGHSSSLCRTSSYILDVVVDAMKKRSPGEALVIVVIVCTCIAIGLAGVAWNIAAEFI